MKVQGTGAGGGKKPARPKGRKTPLSKKTPALKKKMATTKKQKALPKTYTGPSPYNPPPVAGPSVSDLVNLQGSLNNTDWAKGLRVMDIESQPDSLDMAIKKIQRKIR